MTTDDLVPAANQTTATNNLLSIRNLAVDAQVRDRTIRLLSDISIDVPSGGTLGIVGESGSGKSLTALSIMGLLPSALEATAGSIHLRECDLLTAGRRVMGEVRGGQIGMIFQDPQNSLNPAYTIGSQLVETIRAHDSSLDKSAAKARAVELLKRVGINRAAERLSDYPHQFSGGMAQRVMIALAISSGPSLLIADEPTTALDVTVQAQILSLLRSIQSEMSMTLVLISHDLAVIAQMADEVAVLYAGELVEHGPVKSVFGNPQHPYTSALLGAQPEAAVRTGRLIAIDGTVPEAGTVTTGCRFRDRCQYATTRCTEDHPDLREVANTRVRCHLADELTLAAPTQKAGRAEVRAPKSTSGTPLLEVDHVTKVFRLGGRLFGDGKGELVAVADTTLQVWPGETLGIVGESGAGKSTVGRLILGLEQPTSGTVRFDGLDVHQARGKDLKSIRRSLSVVFQNPYASLDPSMSIADSVLEPITTHEHISRTDRAARARELLDEVGLSGDYVDRRPHELSGGQRQRVAIARALAIRPRLVVCDEAVSALDVSTQAQVLNLLADLQEEHGMAYVFVGHDLAVVRHISDRIAVMHHGHVVETGPADEVYHQPIHPYTRALLSAVLTTDLDAQQIRPSSTTTETRPPSEGCAFAPQCPDVQDICRKRRPELRAHGRSEVACHVALERNQPRV